MKQTVDAIIILPVKAIFKAVFFYFMFHKRKVVLTQWTIIKIFFEITRLVCYLIVVYNFMGFSGRCCL